MRIDSNSFSSPCTLRSTPYFGSIIYRFSQGLIDHSIAFSTVKDKTDWIAAFLEAKEAVGKCTQQNNY